MPDLGTSTAAPARPTDADTNGHRVQRRRTLPGGRAVVGALLITLAVIGVFAAWLSATAAPTTTWVVMATAVAAGDEIVEDDVEAVPIDLPDDQAIRAFANPAEVIGSVALAPLADGDLVTRSVVRPPDEVPGTARFSFELPLARALAGQVDPGDRVDVMATADGRTGFVATDLEVVRGTIEGGLVTITLAIDDPGLVLALGNAVDEATVHLVTSVPGSSGDRAVADAPFPAAGTDGDSPSTDVAVPTPDPAATATADADPGDG